jgi:Flp pilus assembly protein TadG
MGFELKTKILKNQKGTSIVEFAIILPLLIILIFGMVEFSILYYNRAIIVNASREGARAAIVFRADPVTGIYTPLTRAEVQAVVDSYTIPNLVGFPPTTALLDPGLPGYTPCPATPTIGVDDYVVVSVGYDYNWIFIPNFLPFLPSPFRVWAPTTMSCENRR